MDQHATPMDCQPTLMDYEHTLIDCQTSIMDRRATLEGHGPSLMDLEPSLADLLTFVDSNFGMPECKPIGVKNSSDEAPSVPERQRSSPSLPKGNAPSKRDKDKSAQASRLYREKKRAEMAGLRAQAAAPENQLAKLNCNNTRFRRPERRARTSLGANQVLREKARRQEAESRNGELRAAVAEHLRVVKAIHDALRHAAIFVLQDLHPVPSTMPAVPLSGLHANTVATKDRIMDEMAASLSQLYVAAATTFSRTNPADLDGTTSKQRQKRDLVSELPYVEVEHLATLPVAMPKAAQVLQDMLATSSQPIKPGDLQGAHYMRFVGGFRDKSRSVTLDILRVSRGHEEADRYIFTAVSALFDHPGTGALCFQDRSWIVVARSPTNPQSECVIQTHFQVSPAVSSLGSNPQDSSAVNKVTDLVLQQSGSVYHSAILAIQEVMTLGDGQVVCSEYPAVPV